MAVRVRMAPSPTGFLHIGGVRTFLFNWLFARGRGGECRLRIENTHVSRGDDHVSNTPKQIQILQALGAEIPVYAHAPNLLGPDGRKLSKRHGAQSIEEFRDAGYLPEALMNFLALLGWSYDDRTTIMSRDELIERFTLERVGSSPATFDYQKLDWMNGDYLRAMSVDEYVAALVAYLREQRYDWDEQLVRRAAPHVEENIERP